jgi:hypothetical protein
MIDAIQLAGSRFELPNSIGTTLGMDSTTHRLETMAQPASPTMESNM